jgi:hypothetical protein
MAKNIVARIETARGLTPIELSSFLGTIAERLALVGIRRGASTLDDAHGNPVLNLYIESEANGLPAAPVEAPKRMQTATLIKGRDVRDAAAEVNAALAYYPNARVVSATPIVLHLIGGVDTQLLVIIEHDQD